eukprot:s884_g23.t1
MLHSQGPQGAAGGGSTARKSALSECKKGTARSCCTHYSTLDLSASTATANGLGGKRACTLGQKGVLLIETCIRPGPTRSYQDPNSRTYKAREMDEEMDPEDAAEADREHSDFAKRRRSLSEILQAQKRQNLGRRPGKAKVATKPKKKAKGAWGLPEHCLPPESQEGWAVQPTRRFFGGLLGSRPCRPMAGSAWRVVGAPAGSTSCILRQASVKWTKAP